MTWEDIRRESKAEGRREERQEAILELLEELGTVSEMLRDRILSETEIDTLKTMTKLANKAGSVEEFEEQISNL